MVSVIQYYQKNGWWAQVSVFVSGAATLTYEPGIKIYTCITRASCSKIDATINIIWTYATTSLAEGLGYVDCFSFGTQRPLATHKHWHRSHDHCTYWAPSLWQKILLKVLDLRWTTTTKKILQRYILTILICVNGALKCSQCIFTLRTNIE